MYLVLIDSLILVPFEMKVCSNASRGYYLIISDKNQSKLPSLDKLLLYNE